MSKKIDCLKQELFYRLRNRSRYSIANWVAFYKDLTERQQFLVRRLLEESDFLVIHREKKSTMFLFTQRFKDILYKQETEIRFQIWVPKEITNEIVRPNT